MKKINYLFVTSILCFASCSEDEPEKTLTDPPVIAAATEVSATTFTANWESVSGAKFYKLEVSKDIAFTDILGDYNNLEVKGTSLSVEGLSGDQKYFYRVKAGNSKGETVVSKVAAVRRVTKSLIYNQLWKGDEVNSNVTFIFMDMYFGSDGSYTAYFGNMVMSTGTWSWKGDTDVMAVDSSTGSFEITFLDVSSSGYVAYYSALTNDLVYFTD